MNLNNFKWDIFRQSNDWPYRCELCEQTLTSKTALNSEMVIQNIVKKLKIYANSYLPDIWCVCDNCFDSVTNTCIHCSKKFIYLNLNYAKRLNRYVEFECQQCLFKKHGDKYSLITNQRFDKLMSEHYYIQPDFDINRFEQDYEYRQSYYYHDVLC